MYGIVNKGIEEIISENYGIEVWHKIKDKAGVDVDFFISNDPYDDSITYNLALAAASELNITVSDVLIAFGEFWVLNTGKKKYGALMESGGTDLRGFIINLPNFHNRVSLIYPNLTPPEFMVTEIKADSMRLHYYSKRLGLEEFVRGLLQGLSKMFNEPISIDMVKSRADGSDHEAFIITWL